MYRLVDSGTWDDPWFESLPPDAKLFFLYLITNAHTTSCGAMEMSARKMAFESGLEVARVTDLLETLGGRVRWWPEHNVVWVKNFYRRNNHNPKMAINARGVVAGLPLCVQAEIGMVYPDLAPPTHTPSIGYADGIDKISKEQEQEEEKDQAQGKGKEPSAPVVATTETPYQVLEVLCDATGLVIGRLTTREKNSSLAVAKRLLADGVTCAEVRAYVGYLIGQEWRTEPVTMFTVEKGIGTWRASGMPANPKASARASPPVRNRFEAAIERAREKDKQDESRRNGQGTDADQRALLADAQRGPAERGPDDRNLDESLERRPIDAVYRMRS